MTFFFTSVFIFLVFWRPQDWLMPWLFGWPVLDVIVVLAVFALLIENDAGMVKYPRDTPQIRLLVGLWIAAVLSHVANTYFAGMMETIPEMFKICFFTVLLFCVMDRPSRLQTVSLIFVVMACIMTVHALMQKRLGYGFSYRPPLYIPATLAKPEQWRTLFFGIFEDPNDLCQILATSIPLVFAVPRRMNFLNFILCCAVSYFILSGALTTHSRGGYVALAGVFSVMFALILPARWLPSALILLGIAALLLCPLSAGYLDMSAHDRVVFWGMANYVFKQNILFGIGSGMFWQIAQDRAAHNAFVSCYTEIGIVGYFFWFSLVFLGFVGAWRTRVAVAANDDEESRYLRRFSGLAIAAMTGFLASAYFLSRTFVYPLFFLMAMMGSLPAIARQYLPENHPPLIDMKKDVLTRAPIFSMASVVYIYFSIILLNRAFYG